MPAITIAGLINIETTVTVSEFPIAYTPVQYPFFGVKTTVAGVGYNISKALLSLGHSIKLCSIIGDDEGAMLTRAELDKHGLTTNHLLTSADATAQSAILYDPSGKRMIYTDLKNIQDLTYSIDQFKKALTDADMAILCNINFSRPLLPIAKAAGIPIATDVHAIADPDDDYNTDYMQAADILFLSHERLPDSPETFVKQLQERYSANVIVVGMGGEGALLAVRDDNYIARHPSVYTRPVVNTVGAGDSLFSAFVHGMATHHDPYKALQAAQVFASYKIGGSGGADGFLTASELDHWVEKV